MSESVYLDDQPSGSQSVPLKTAISGLTLRLPPLKSGKLIKPGKKRKSTSFADHPKAIRPPKLKPLKEVLTRLIAQIKKKDDYAFFLNPVDPRLVPGYTDVVQRPMDFGTMTNKAAKGKYRSLEDFASDFRLVVSNAKIFNPPGTIYHSEAERVEVWGLDRINKAAATVIEFETDWNIEIEGDDDQSIVNDDDEDLVIPGPLEDDHRSPSVASNQPQGNRRGTRAAASKKSNISISESLEPDGSLPGAKDGLGVFPPGSDWAHLMLALKLKGKKYRTKKERMRVEKSGPPIAADGSLDYWEMEDPFTIFEALVPKPLTKPQLTPLYQTGIDPVSSCSISASSPVNISLKRKFPHVPPELTAPCPKRRHWSISRHTARNKAKENDEEDILQLQKTTREPQTTDFGSLSTLMAELTQEQGIQSVSEETKLFDALRSDLEHHAPTSSQDADPQSHPDVRASGQYIQDIVYGGVEGLAYTRSLAEFIGFECPVSTPNGLGVPLSKWVEDSVVDYITQGRHRILQEAINVTENRDTATATLDGPDDIRPHSHHRMLGLIEALTGKVDLSCLIRAPNDLFQADDEWYGATFKKERRRRIELDKERSLTTPNGKVKNAVEYLAFAIQSHRQGENEEEETTVEDLEDDSEVFEHVLNVTGQALGDMLDKKSLESSGNGEDTTTRAMRLNLLALAKRIPANDLSWPEF